MFACSRTVAGRSRLFAMPLRAKILTGALPRQMSTQKTYDFENVADDVLYSSHSGLREVLLNRPKKLNALNMSMVTKMVPRFVEWSKSELADVIVLKGSGRAFCAGGDIAELAKLIKAEGEAGSQKATEFFATEYLLDYIIATYPKPIVSLMDGITMGGGVGLAGHTPFRIATEKTVFAMPETLIGFYPDVGTSFFLSRLDGELGTYFAMTGERASGIDTLMTGVATHYVESRFLDDLEARLRELRLEGLDYTKFNAVVNEAINDFATELPADYVNPLGGAARKTIDDCFKHDSVEKILEALEADGSEFAQKALAAIREKSPTSVRVALRAVREGKSWDIMTAFKKDMQLSSRFMRNPNFVAGVTARVIDKPASTPQWDPASFDQITELDAYERFFKATDADAETLGEYWKGLDALKTTYDQYPYNNGLPTEAEVRAYVLGEDPDSSSFLMTKDEIVKYFVEEYRGKVGVKQKVADILDRKTQPQKGYEEEKLVNWV
ncbi:mitochondrial 37S ribosomal protein mS47 [Dipodascopsis tothii]|uniref:mitochondrial 37S ribosomal protein mS47 n=1 Tax=Dipodascopsis tothii TaxID=44089 RepID=UPI0034CDBA81